MQRTLRALVALGLAALAMTGLAGVFAGDAPLALKSSVAALLAVAVWRPAEALLLLAAFGPFGGALGALGLSGDGWTVPLLLAFSSGYVLRQAWRPAVADPRFRLVALTWVAIVLISLARVLAMGSGGHLSSAVATWAARGFPLRWDVEFTAIGAAAIAITGVVVFVATADECAAHPHLNRRIVAMLLVGVAATGAVNVYRFFEVALRHPPFPQSIIELHRSLRVSATIPDVNAAGAFFLLTLPTTLCLLRERGQRTLAAVTLAPTLAGLWLAGSRTALIVFALTVAAMAALAPGRARRWRVGLGLGVLLAAAVVGVFYPRGQSTGDAGVAFGVRREMAAATLRMLRDHPVAGVGVGQYRSFSPIYTSPLMKSWYAEENAHNQFLQVAGELGLPGFIVFVVLVGFGAIPAARIAWRDPDPVDRGAAFGLLAFLVASLTMHPLLTPEVAATFWMMLGLCRSHGGAFGNAAVRVGPQGRERFTKVAGLFEAFC